MTKEQERLQELRDIFNEQERLSSPHGRIEKDSGGKNETWKLFLGSFLGECNGSGKITTGFFEKFKWEFWPEDLPIPKDIKDLSEEDKEELKTLKQRFNEPQTEPKKKRKYTKRAKKKKVEKIEEPEETIEFIEPLPEDWGAISHGRPVPKDVV